MSRDLSFDIGIVTDEVTHDLADAFAWGAAHGIRRFELREGREARFPEFTNEEIRIVEDALRGGHQISAVSPGILKGPVGDRERIEHERREVLPRALALAERFACDTIVVFGFERTEGEPAAHRQRVLETFEQVADAAAAKDMRVLVENEPDFWVDRPADEAALLEEIDHPALGANWDPANAVWGGARLRQADVERLAPFLQNLHVKDHDPENASVPWVPVGQGNVPWRELLDWIAAAAPPLEAVTLETHCEPLKENSEQSLGALRSILERSSAVSERTAPPSSER